MSWQNASTWGLTSTGDRDWTRQSACIGQWSIFDVVGKGLSADNEDALALCDSCPVRVKCRDSYLLDARRVPLGLIAGGWWWDHSGNVHPHTDDVEPTADAPAPAPRKRATERRITVNVRAARNAVTAARAKVANPALTYKDAAQRYGTNFRAVCDAVAIAQYAPDLLHAVWDGRRTLASAYSEANHRRTDSEQLEGVAS